MTRADVVLILANILYGTSYVASRIALDAIPPASLALVRLLLAIVMLFALAPRSGSGPRPSRGDRRRIAWMGILGFTAAYALAHWGVSLSTVTNAALLIVVEPIAVIALSPLLLRERLGRREAGGAALALLGTVLVVVNGVPGVTERIAPHWPGDVLLVLSGVAFASYTLIGRDVLARHAPFGVTLWSIVWGTVAIVPFAGAEWVGRERLALTPAAVAATLYLGLVISGLGYLVWNWAIQRVEAPQAAVFLTIQPVVGACLGMALLGERFTRFTLAGGALIVLGLVLTVCRPATRGGTGRAGILDSCPSPADTSSRTPPPTA
ncbi:MAG: DMT family transporter [Candidatus Rokubacteria bacterium]|nr:DMT family transporter [Candidatus Rokubacteria bacterium]